MSESKCYTASITHNKETIEKLFIVQYHTYEKYMLLVKTIFALGILVVAFLTDMAAWARALLIFIGTVSFATRDLKPQLRADKVAEERGGSFPEMEYTFFKDNFRLSGEGQMALNYKKITRLVNDKNYFFLFMSKDSVCMVDKNTLKPCDCSKFMNFISEKAGLSWENEKSFLSYNLKDFVKVFTERNKK